MKTIKVEFETIEELESFFKDNPIKENYELREGLKIANPVAFLRNHFDIIKAGNDKNNAYLDRLLELRTKLQTTTKK